MWMLQGKGALCPLQAVGRLPAGEGGRGDDEGREMKEGPDGMSSGDWRRAVGMERKDFPRHSACADPLFPW